MKARVKAIGEIVEIIDIDFDTLFCNNGGHYTLEQIEGIECDPDYWTRLEHQYAGMAMNALLLTNNIRNGDLEGMRECNTNAMAIAHALVEKYKKEEK